MILCLAALVKLLRRCLSQMNGKTQQFLNTSVKYEREALLQIESVKLAAESSTRQLEAELAHARRDAAQAAAAHKAAAASWQSELDYQKAEVGNGAWVHRFCLHTA